MFWSRPTKVDFDALIKRLDVIERQNRELREQLARAKETLELKIDSASEDQLERIKAAVLEVLGGGGN